MYLSSGSGSKRGVSFGYMVYADEDGAYHFLKVAGDNYLFEHMVTFYDGDNISYGNSGPMLDATVSPAGHTTINYDARRGYLTRRLATS